MDFEKIFESVITWLISSGSKLLFGLIILYIVFKLINKISNIIRKTLIKRNTDKLILNIVFISVRKGLKLLTFILFLGYVGIDTAGIGAAIGSIFVGVGLALQGSLSNLAGGIIILLIRPFNIDDYIETTDYSGTVEEIGIFYTTLRTPDNKVILVPNGELANNEIINYNRKPTRRIEKVFSVSYDSNISLVKKIIEGVCEKNELILKDPIPFIKVKDYGENSIDLLCRVWVKSTDYFSVFFDLMDEVKEAFDNNNIVIPYRQMDVHFYDEKKK